MCDECFSAPESGAGKVKQVPIWEMKNFVALYAFLPGFNAYQANKQVALLSASHSILPYTHSFLMKERSHKDTLCINLFILTLVQCVSS